MIFKPKVYFMTHNVICSLLTAHSSLRIASISACMALKVKTGGYYSSL